jgi:hypothetical protein
MTDEFYRVAKQMANNTTFYCPNGHGAAFSLGETEEAKMRRERDNALQRVAEWQDYAKAEETKRLAAERSAAAARGQVTKIKKRTSAGVCPCCNRHFTQLERHMGSKHPDFAKETATA